MSVNTHPLRIKFLSKIETDIWLHQLPDNNPAFNNCLFIFDRNESNYDWLVVYDDLPSTSGERFPMSEERLGCQPDNTVLITIEPSSVKVYGKNYTDQFGHVITSQPASSLPHKNRIYSQPSLFWFYGLGNDRIKPYEELVTNYPKKKTGSLSVVWSNKKQRHTAHHQRLKFLSIVREQIAGLNVYGRGEIVLDDKAEALDEYQYHIAIENHYGPHHWTEKLADPFLSLTLPFYYGCPNLDDYFPEESYIPIDIYQPEKSIEIIRAAIRNKEYEKRKTALITAKQTLIEKYNLFVVLTELINKNTRRDEPIQPALIRSRRAANRQNFLVFLSYFFKKSLLRTKHFFISRLFRTTFL